MLFIKKRIVEAYVGEYASGKSEISINRALELLDQDKEVTLVDLDLVEPFYTLRPVKKMLQDKGLYVVAWETQETMGLGEAGSILKPEMKWVLRRPGDIIMDIGYGVEGARTLDLIEEIENSGLMIYVVINVGRPMTASVNDITEYVRELGRVDGLINNSHLGDETRVDFVQEGALIVKEAANSLNIPFKFTYVEKSLFDAIGPKDITGTPVKTLNRYMPASFW